MEDRVSACTYTTCTEDRVSACTDISTDNTGMHIITCPYIFTKDTDVHVVMSTDKSKLKMVVRIRMNAYDEYGR